MKYYIFGIDAINAYQLESIEGFIKKMKEDNSLGILYKYDSNDNINTLLNDFSGWGDYYEISKETYNYLNYCIYGI